MEKIQASGERCSWCYRSLLADGFGQVVRKIHVASRLQIVVRQRTKKIIMKITVVVNVMVIASAQFLIFLVGLVQKVSSAIICVKLEISVSCIAEMMSDMTLSSSVSIRS